MNWKSLAVLLAVVLLVGCANEKSENTPVASATSPQAGPPIGEVASAISKDVGAVVATNDGGYPRIVVFDETHVSRIGQVEIATMLVRLHEHYRMTRIALEGEFLTGGPLRAKWFHDLGRGEASRDTALRLLREGEIGACEFAAIAFPDVQVTGSESEDEYGLTLSDAGSTAPISYLLAIGGKLLSQEQIGEANSLIQQGRKEEALKYILKANDWTKERYAKLTDSSQIISAEDQLTLMHEIEAKAGETGADVDDATRSGLADAVKFYEMAEKRTGTMTRNAITIARGSTEIVAMNVGAAHTSALIAQLKAAGATFAVVHPLSLTAHDEHGELSMAAFSRKDRLASVDSSGLGGFLDGRHHKPRSVLDKRWLHSKAQIYYSAVVIAKAAAAGGDPPFSDIAPLLAAQDSIKVDPTSFQVVDDNGRRAVVFSVVARTDDRDPSQTVELWVKTLKEPPGPPQKPPTASSGAAAGEDDSSKKSLETLLLDTRKELSKEETKKEDKDVSDAPPREPVLLPISKDTKAVFAKSREEVLRTSI